MRFDHLARGQLALPAGASEAHGAAIGDRRHRAECCVSGLALDGEGGSIPAPAAMPDKFISEVRRRRRRWPWIAGAVALLLIAGGIIGYFIFIKKQDNFNDPNAEIDTTAAPKPKKQKPETFKGPTSGFTPHR